MAIPVWLEGLFSYLDSPLSPLYERFCLLVSSREVEDENFSSDDFLSLADECRRPIDMLGGLPAAKLPSIWKDFFPHACLPCGCNLPCPLSLAISISQPPDAKLVTEMPPQGAEAIERAESNRSSFENYYQASGRTADEWQDFTCSFISSSIQVLPTSLLISFNTLHNILKESSTPPFRIYGSHICIHFMFMWLWRKVETGECQKFKRQQKIMLAFCLCLLESNCFIEIKSTKQNVYRSFSRYNDKDEVPPSEHTYENGRRFQLSQLLRKIQITAFSELILVHNFLKTNCAWLKQQYISDGTEKNKIRLISTCPHFGVIDITPNYNDSKEINSSSFNSHSIDWMKLCSLNIGLTSNILKKLLSKRLDYTGSLEHI